MSVLQHMPFTPSSEKTSISRDRRDAQIQLSREGRPDHFICVRLLDMYDPDWRERFGPVKIVNLLRHRVGVAGNKYELELKVEDGHVFFDWDGQIGQHVAWFYDDAEGYNVGVLGSHFYNGLFEIMDEKDRAGIEKIAIQKRAEGQKIKPVIEETPLSNTQIAEMSVEGLDEQIKFLKQKKKEALAQKPQLQDAEPEQVSVSKSVKEPEPVVSASPKQSPVKGGSKQTGKKSPLLV